MKKANNVKTIYLKDPYQHEQTHLIELGIQFYIAARICYCRDLKGLFHIIPLLFRHAIEYLIKGYLSYDMGMKEIKNKYRHSLGKLWEKFKKIEEDTSLNKYDNFIKVFNETEGIRYPKGSELKPGQKDAFELDLEVYFNETAYDLDGESLKWDITTIDGIIYEILHRMRNPLPSVEWVKFKFSQCPELFKGNKYFKIN